MPNWLISPFLPAQGIVLLHGRFSLGKSPLTWKIAHSVTTGDEFFGMPVNNTGPVLYIEVDTPEPQVKKRLRLLKPQPNEKFFMANAYPYLNMMITGSKDVLALRESYKTIEPVLVIVNTLRKIHSLDQNMAETPSHVYKNLLECFPKSSILVVHHDKKIMTGDMAGDPDEAFSGSQAWANDATVALHLRGLNHRERTLELVVTKSQVGATGSLIRMQLSEDGTNFTDDRRTQAIKMYQELQVTQPDLGKEEKVQKVSESLGIHRTTMYRYLSMGG